MKLKPRKKTVLLVFLAAFIFSLLTSVIALAIHVSQLKEKVNQAKLVPAIKLITSTPRMSPPTNSKTYDSNQGKSKEEIAKSWVIFDENDNFSVKIGEIYPDTKEVEITIISKSTDKEYPIQEKLKVWGAAILSNSDDKQYVLFSCGTYVNRTAFVIDLTKGKLVVPPFIITNGIEEHLFVGSKLVYNSLNSSPGLQNRFDGSGGKGISVLNLVTKELKDLYSPDLLNEYWLQGIENNNILILHQYVTSESEWKKDTAISKETITHSIYDL